MKTFLSILSQALVLSLICVVSSHSNLEDEFDEQDDLEDIPVQEDDEMQFEGDGTEGIPEPAKIFERVRKRFVNFPLACLMTCLV